MTVATELGVSWRGAHLTIRNQVERGVWGALSKVGSLLGKLSMGLGLSSPHHCPPSVIGSTKKERRCGPGVTHSRRAGQQIRPALYYLPSPASTVPHPQATFLQMTDAHSGMGMWGSTGDCKAGPERRLGHTHWEPLPLLPDQARCLRNQPQQLHFFPQGLPQTSAWWGRGRGPAPLPFLCASPPRATGTLSA